MRATGLVRSGARGGFTCSGGVWRSSEAVGRGAGPLGPPQGRSGGNWAPRPSQRPESAGRGPGGPAPGRPQSWCASRPGLLGGGAVRALLEEEMGSQEHLSGGWGIGWPSWGSWVRAGPRGPPVGGAGGEGPAELREGLRAFGPARGCSGSNDTPPPSPGRSWGFQDGLPKLRCGRTPG